MTVTVPAADGGLSIVREPAKAAVLLDPERRRLLEALREQPDSASGLARRLDDSRQRLNYHLRSLEEAGLVELREERKRGNCVERVLQAVARRFVVDPAALGELTAEPEAAGDRFSTAHLVALAARTIREVADLTERATAEEKRFATGALTAEVSLARPADFEAFVEDLSRAVAGVVARHHDEQAAGARTFRMMMGMYQAPGDSRQEEDQE